jgi:hypothetical protein
MIVRTRAARAEWEFATEAEVDTMLDSLSKELKARICEGFTVVVK